MVVTHFNSIILMGIWFLPVYTKRFHAVVVVCNPHHLICCFYEWFWGEWPRMFRKGETIIHFLFLWRAYRL